MTHRRARSRSILIPLLAGLATVALVAVIAPKPFGLRHHTSGDADLASRIEAQLTGGYRHHVAAVELHPHDAPSFAGWGATLDTEFEIGSLTKTFTAALFADAIKRGEVTADTTLSQVFPEFTKGNDGNSGRAGNITLEELATQHSGLPRLLPSGTLTSLGLTVVGLDPYRVDVPELLSSAATIDPGPKKYAYSNLGFALLGQALAKKAGAPYTELVERRILTPLHMTETTVPTDRSQLPADAPRGRSAAGLPTGRWTGMAHAPSGAMRSTARDLRTWVRAVIAGTAPGADAIKPRAKGDDGERIGYAWHRTAGGMTWKNGGTGGFASFAGFRDDGTGIIVLSDSAVGVDDAAKVIAS